MKKQIWDCTFILIGGIIWAFGLNTFLIPNAIAAGGAEGMISMDQSIFSLYKAGRISKETALSSSDHPEQLQRRLG